MHAGTCNFFVYKAAWLILPRHQRLPDNATQCHPRVKKCETQRVHRGQTSINLTINFYLKVTSSIYLLGGPQV